MSSNFLNSRIILVASLISAILFAGMISGCSKEPKLDQAGTKTSAVGPAVSTKTQDRLPPECDAYLRTVTTCVERAGPGNPAGASFKQQLEASKAEWTKASDKTAFAASCKQMEQNFIATAVPALKC